MRGRGLDQPDVAIEAGTLIGPGFAEADVATDDEDVRLARSGEVGDVDAEGGVAALVRSDDEAVEDDEAVARDTVEFECEAPPGILGRDRQHAAIPADAGRGPQPADRLEPLIGAGAIEIRARRAELLERQIDRPVVRQVDRLPLLVVEARVRDRRADVAGLAIGIVRGAEAEILGRIGGVTEVEAPAAIERHDAAREGRRNGGRRCSRHRRQQSDRAHRAARFQQVAAADAVGHRRNSRWRAGTGPARARYQRLTVAPTKIVRPSVS